MTILRFQQEFSDGTSKGVINAAQFRAVRALEKQGWTRIIDPPSTTEADDTVTPIGTPLDAGRQMAAGQTSTGVEVLNPDTDRIGLYDVPELGLGGRIG